MQDESVSSHILRANGARAAGFIDANHFLANQAQGVQAPDHQGGRGAAKLRLPHRNCVAPGTFSCKKITLRAPFSSRTRCYPIARAVSRCMKLALALWRAIPLS